MLEIIRHLVIGWRGFLGIVTQATTDGVKFDERTIKDLRQAQEWLKDVIERQEKLDGSP